MSLVSFVDAERQWFKAGIGTEVRETEIDKSICAFALDAPDILVISDLTKDERTSRNPLVLGEPHIRFYAGAPLRTAQGQALGSLCVIDVVPRYGGLSAKQSVAMRALARQVMDMLETRRELSERVEFSESVNRSPA